MSVTLTGDGPNISLTGSGSSFTITVTTGGGGGGVTDHGALTGLADDDHTQYAKKASNLSDLTSATSARTALGLGTISTESADAYLAVVVYDFDLDEYPARPDAAVVRWIGPTEPTAWIDWDEWREVAAPPTVPDAPTDVTAVAGNTEADLTWTGPVDNGGSALTGYRITPYIGATAQTPIDVGVVTSYTVTGLTNGTAYTFTVAAENSVGIGAASTASNEVTPEEPSTPIVLVQTKAAGAATTAAARSLTFDTAATAGNLLIAMVATGQSNRTITAPSGWVEVANDEFGSSGQGTVIMFYKVAAGGETTVTLSFSGSSTSGGMAILEYSGIATTSPVDTSDGATTGVGVTATTLTLGPTAAVSQPNVLAVGFIASSADFNPANTWTNSFSRITAASFAQFSVAQLNTDSASGTISTTETWPSAQFVAGILGVFKGV